MKELIAHARELAASETLVIGNDVRNTLANLATAVERQQAEIGDLQSRVRLWTNRADELRLACDKHYEAVKTLTAERDNWRKQALEENAAADLLKGGTK